MQKELSNSSTSMTPYSNEAMEPYAPRGIAGVPQTTGYIGAAQSDNPITGPALLEVLWRRRWTLLLVMAITAGVAWAYLSVTKPIYRATSRLKVEPSNQQLFTESNNPQDSEIFLPSQADALQSASVVQAALDKIHYRELNTFSKLNGDAVDAMRKGGSLKVEAARKSSTITISMDSPDPNEAALIVNTIVDEFINQQASARDTDARKALEGLDAERQKTTAKLDEAAQKMVKLKLDNKVSSFTQEKGNVDADRLNEFSNKYTAAQEETMRLRAMKTAITTALSDPEHLRQFVESEMFKQNNAGDQSYNEQRNQLSQMQLTLQSAMTTQGPNHPRVQGLKDVIKDLQARVEEKEKLIAEAQLGAVVKDLRAAEENEAQLKTAFEQQRNLVLNQNPPALQYDMLQKNYEELQKQLASVEDRMSKIRTNMASTTPMNVQVLDAAHPELDPVRPRKTLTMLAALLLGGLVGMGLALLREWKDVRLHRPEEIDRLLGTPVLAVVPRVNPKLSPVLRGQLVISDPRSAAAEAYRTVRTALQLGSSVELKTILVASPTQGDGKSTTASNLALAFAEAGERTLLLDCDLREPVQHLIFECDARVGLTDVMAGTVKVRDALRRTRQPGLYVLPCGPVPANPSELLASKRFAQLVKAMGQTFDRIVIDSPPLLKFSDARVLAAAANGTVLVFRMNQSMRTLGAVALDGLAKVQANVVGAVANDVPFGRHEQYYGGSWQYASVASRRLPPAVAPAPVRPENAAPVNGAAHRPVVDGIVRDIDASGIDLDEPNGNGDVSELNIDRPAPDAMPVDEEDFTGVTR